jgi:hypothetical protein
MGICPVAEVGKHQSVQAKLRCYHAGWGARLSQE